MPAPDARRDPYPGLRPFEAEEADLFFGRETHVDALLKRLSTGHFVAVVGESGAGKSSLVRAGLLPALQAGFVVEAGSDWRVAVLRPGGAPLVELAEALLQPGVLTDQGGSPRLEFALAELRRGPLGLVQLVNDAHLGPHCNLLIVVDQFEEVFRYCREPAQKDQADIFVELILRAAEQRQIPIFVVLTMRSDFVGDCARFRGLPETLNDNQYLTPRLTREQIAAAIREPARVCGGVVDSALVDALCNAVGDNPDQLPLLQHLLMRVWDRAAKVSSPPRLTSGLAKELGGLQSALNDHAQQVYDSLSTDEQGIARAMFKRLTDPLAQRRDVRRDALVSEIAAVAAAPLASVITVADAFRGRGRHMLMPPSSIPLTEQATLDISHESLIRQWTALKEWAREESVNAREFLRLRDAARPDADGQPDVLTGRDLTRAIDWLKQAEPTPAWASRYSAPGELEATIALINNSTADAQRRKDEERRLRAREAAAKRTTVYSWLSAGALVLAIAIAAVIFNFWQKAETRGSEAAMARGQAHARQLAANARVVLQDDPALSLVLAQAAVREPESDDQAVDALRHALGEHVPHFESPVPIAKSKHYIPGSNKSAWLEFSLDAASLSPRDHSVIVPSRERAVILSTRGSEPARELRGHVGIIGAARFSPDGRLAVTTGADKSARVWDVTTPVPTAVGDPLWHANMINNAVFSRDGSLLVTLGDDSVAKIWTVGHYKEPPCELTTGDNAVTASFSNDQQRLVTVTQRSGAQVWNVENGQCPTAPIRVFADAKWARFSPEQSWLGIVEDDGDAIILRTSDWEPARIIGASSSGSNVSGEEQEPVETGGGVTMYPPPLAWSSDGAYVAVAGRDHTVRVAAVEGATALVPLRGHTGRITSLAFHPHDNILLTTSADRTARLWKLDKDKAPFEVLVLRGHRDSLGSGAFTGNGDDVVTVSDDERVRVWRPNWALRELRFDGIRSAVYTPDGDLWVSGIDSSSSPWASWASKLVAPTLPAPTSVARSDVLRPQFYGWKMLDRLASGGVGVRDVRDINSTLPLAGSEGVSFSENVSSPNGSFVLSTEPELKLWDLTTPQQAAISLTAQGNGCELMAVANDKRTAWYCADDDKILVAGVEPATPKAISIEDGTKAESLRFSSDGSWVAAAFEDYSVRIFDSATGATAAIIRGDDAAIVTLNFSGDDRLLVTVTDDETARVWGVPEGLPIATLPSLGSYRILRRPVFSPDGTSVVFAGGNALFVWRCDACGDRNTLLTEAASRRLERPLSKAEARRFGLEQATSEGGTHLAAAHSHRP